MSFLNNLLGTSVQAPNVMQNVNPTGFSGGGLFGGFNKTTNNYSIGSDPTRQAAVQGVANTFGAQAADIGNLRQQWAPGSSALRSSLMTALQNNRTQALGDLRSNLAQRRVLGSSFAQNSLANADQTYQQGIQQIQAQTFLEELQAQQQLSQQQFAAQRGQFQTGLDELNLEAGLASDLTSKATSALTSAAQTQAQLDLQAQVTNANNTMKTLGGLGSLIGMGLGGGFFNGLGGAAFGGGSLFSGDAYGGSSSNPLPGLTAADYGVGF